MNVERTISPRFLGIILRVLRLEVSVYNDTMLQIRLKPLLLGGGGGREYNPLVEVIVKSKEENFLRLLNNYVQEIGLSSTGKSNVVFIQNE